MRKSKKLIFGVGINDADYEVQPMVNGKRVWCPFYRKWFNMLLRCYSENYQQRRPTYIGCYVILEWLRFSNFKSWMIEQDWEEKQLDKDILFKDNKVYGTETCVFVDKSVNLFLLERGNDRGKWPIGVNYCKRDKKFIAKCWSVEIGKQKHLGMFLTPDEAHQAWLAFKLDQAYILAEQQTDVRVAEALINRYENYNLLGGPK